MKRLLNFFILSLFFLSCKQKIQLEAIPNINGYWQIEKVVFGNGNDKIYNANSTYDYFQINKNNIGFRKKVTPQLDGTFLVDNTYEKVSVSFKGDKTYLHYVTPYMRWTEELVVLTAEKLVLSNSQNKTYHYKKVRITSIFENGKKSK